MAQRREADRGLSAVEVHDAAEERFPSVEWDGVEDWDSYVARSRRRREDRNAFAAEHGYNAMDLFVADFDRTHEANPCDSRPGNPAGRTLKGRPK